MLLTACSSADPAPDIDAAVAGTVSAREAALLQPQLVAPAEGASFETAADVTLEWHWARLLDENEHFDVQVWREGEPQFGISWSDEDSFDLSNWLASQEPGEFFWSIAVVEGTDGTVTANIAEAPPARSFTVTQTAPPTATPPPEFNINTVVRVPQGFTATRVAQVEGAILTLTTMTFTPNGDILTMSIQGTIWRLSDTDGDFIIDEVIKLRENGGEDGMTLDWATGLAFYEDRYYVSDAGRIGYFQDTDGDNTLDSYTLIIEDLPSRLYPLHSNNGIVFDADGLLYVGIGSTTDHGPLNPDEPYESSILRMEADGSNVEIFATGFRNPYDLEFSPDGRLFTGDNAPDVPDPTMSFYPPEELNYVREGFDYGFPDAYGFNRTIRDIDRETEPAVSELITSSVTTGVAYYSGEMFPEQYHDGVFVAQFGGNLGNGYDIVFVPLEETENGGLTGTWQDFIQFRNGHNPSDVDMGPDGALYFIEWSGGQIIRVTYDGEPTSE